MIKSKWVIGNVLAIKLYEIVHEFDIGVVINSMLGKNIRVYYSTYFMHRLKILIWMPI